MAPWCETGTISPGGGVALKSRFVQVSESVEITGHLMDSGVLARILDDVLDYGGDYTVDRIDLGKAHEDESHAVINVGSGIGVPARTLVKELIAVAGYDGPVHEDSAGSARSGDLDWQQADISRARTDLGWRPCRDLASSVADLWEGSGG